MKKMIIATLTAIALVGSVIGCQIYDSQTNETIKSSMNALGEGTMNREVYIANFTADCNKFVEITDLSSDEAKSSFEKVINYYFSYDSFYTTIKTVLADDTNFTGDASNDLNDS